MSQQPPDPSDTPPREVPWPATIPARESPDELFPETIPGMAAPDVPCAAPVRPPVPALLEVMRRLGLLSAEQLAEAERLAADHDSEALCRELHRREWLTPLQVNRLLQGQGDTLAVGGYVLLARLGAGGMGTVFKARHARLGRLVALKVISQSHLGSEDAVRRFRREVKTTSRLSHPNVVRALDAGQDGKTLYLILELVEGTDLSRVVAQRGMLPVHEACECVRQAALGLQHAHEHGLVHRDIKPSNLILGPGPAGALLVKLLDLGLSRGAPGLASADSTSLTETGSIMGTPDYMAPEQVRDSKRADIRSDLYSLGCTFYFLLCGQAPFCGGTIGLKLVQHQMDEPEPVEELRPEVPTAVAAVVRRLMAKVPEDRYQTPGEVAAVLAAVLEGANWSPAGRFDALAGDATEVVNSPSFARRLAANWSPRRLLLAGATGVVVVPLVFLLLWALTKPKPESKPPAEETEEYALDRLSGARIPLDERVTGRPAELVQVLGEHRGRHWTGTSHLGGLAALTFGPDGKFVYSVAYDQVVRAWDAETLREVAAVQHLAPLAVLGLTQGGKSLYGSRHGDFLVFWSLPELKQTKRLDFAVNAVSPDGNHAVRHAGSLKLHDLRDGTSVTLLEKGDVDGYPPGMAFSPDSRLVAHASRDGGVVLCETKKGKEVGRFAARRDCWVTCLAFSPDGKWLLSGGTDRKVRLWDVSTTAQQKEWAFRTVLRAVAFAPNHKRIVALPTREPPGAYVATEDGEVRPIGDDIESERYAVVLAVSPDGKRAALGDGAGRVRLWDLDTGKEAVPTRGAQGEVSSLVVSPDGKRIVITCLGQKGGQAMLWDVESGKVVRSQEEKGSRATAATLAADGKSCHFAVGMGELVRCDLETGSMKRVPPALGRPIRAMCPLPVGRLAACSDSGVVLIDPAGKGVPARLAGHTNIVLSIASGGEGEGFRLVSGGCAEDSNRGFKVWDAAGGLIRSIHLGDKWGDVNALAVSPDGKWLAAGSPHGNVELWEMSALNRPRKLLHKHSGDVRALAFFPDSNQVASAGSDGVVLVRTVGGTLVKQFTMPGGVTALAVDRKGKYLITGNGNGTVYVLRMAGGR